MHAVSPLLDDGGVREPLYMISAHIYSIIQLVHILTKHGLGALPLKDKLTVVLCSVPTGLVPEIF